MKKVVITKDTIKYYHILHRESDWTPHRPYCRLCSKLVRLRGRISEGRSTISYFEEGETVYRVEYANGHVGLYHVDCIEHPSDRSMECNVREIMRYDKDRWADIASVVTQLRADGLANREIVRRLQTEYKCSQATAYRRLARVSAEIS